MKICLVGGAVRDILMGHNAYDLDYLVLGAGPEEFLRAYPDAVHVGKNFPVFILNHSEYAFPRRPVSHCCSVNPSAQIQAELMADLESRDLTINALAIPLPNYPRLPTSSTAFTMATGHPRGLEDLRLGILRPCSAHCFLEDPLRVFRAARFAAQFPNFHVHKELRAAIAEVCAKDLIKDIQPERIGLEIRKVFRTDVPSRFFDLIISANCMSPWFQEFEESACASASTPSVYGAAYALTALREYLRNAPLDPKEEELLGWMAFVHAIGKTEKDSAQRTLCPNGIADNTHAAKLAHSLGSRLRLPSRFIKAGELWANCRGALLSYSTLSPEQKVHLLRKTHTSQLTREVFTLVLALSGNDLRTQAGLDLARIQSVHLPPEEQNLGPESGRRLLARQIASLQNDA